MKLFVFSMTFHGPVISRSRYITVPLYHGRVISRSRYITVPLYHGPVISRSRYITVPLYHGPVIPRSRITVLELSPFLIGPGMKLFTFYLLDAISGRHRLL